jgi:hypothetical protein
VALVILEAPRLDCIAFAPEESFFMHFTIAPDGGFGQALLSGINRGLGNFSLHFPVKRINDRKPPWGVNGLRLQRDAESGKTN